MTSRILSVGGVASILAHLLLIGASLVIQGFALKQRNPAAGFSAMALGLACGATALILAGNWPECVGLVFSVFVFAPLLLGLVVIRENQVGVVIKKFSNRDVSVTGNAGGNGLLDSMLGLLVKEKSRGEKTA